MENCDPKNELPGQCDVVGEAGKVFIVDDESCATEVLIEQGHGSYLNAPTSNGTFSQLRTDDKFRHRILHTACVCWTMVAKGWRLGLVGPTFPDLRLIIQEDLSTASWIITAIFIGGLIGSMCSGALYDRVNKTTLFVCILTTFGLVAAVTPWCSNFPAMFAAHTVHGVCTSAIDTVVTADLVKVWKMNAGPFLQAAHFATTIGAIISPFATEPFLAKRINQFIDGEHISNCTGFVNSSVSSIDEVTCSNELTFTANISNAPSLIVPEQFGETKVYVTYFISTAISLSAASFFILLNYRRGSVYEIADECVGSQGNQDTKVYTLNKRWKIYLTLIVAVLLTFYCMSERNFTSFLMTFTITSLEWSKTDGASVSSVFWVAFACGRFSGIFVVKFLSISSVLCLYIGVLSVGSISLWLSVIYGIDSLVWISVALVGLGFSVIVASVFSWMSEKVRRLTGTITSVVFVVMSIGSIVMPIVIGYLMEEVSYIWFIYIQLILVVCVGVAFTVLEIIHRRLFRDVHAPALDEDRSREGDGH